MQTKGNEVHADVEEARAASTPNVVRWVLTISLLAAIVLLTAIWVIGAWSSDQNTQSAEARIGEAQQNAGGSRNDSIVSEHADEMETATRGESTEPQNMPNNNSNGD
jgi:hypothetical protein